MQRGVVELSVDLVKKCPFDCSPRNSPQVGNVLVFKDQLVEQRDPSPGGQDTRTLASKFLHHRYSGLQLAFLNLLL